MPAVLWAAVLVPCACAPAAPGTRDDASAAAWRAIRLTDRMDAARVTGRTDGPSPIPPATRWTFDAADREDAAGGWTAGPGLSELSVEGAALVGRATEDFPVLHAEVTELPETPDRLHALEVRMQVSDGADLWFGLSYEPDLDAAEFREWWTTQAPMTSPLVPGDEFHTYRVLPPRPVLSRGLRHVVLRPTDVADAEVRIESVRLVWGREHLAELPSGVSWQGLGEVYRETIVSRSPESLAFDVDLPSRPRLELSVATLGLLPQQFRIRVSPRDGGGGAAVEHAVTATVLGRWQPVSLDLLPLAGRPATVSLGLAGEQDGQVGLWGNPVIRAGGQDGGGRPQGVILVMVDTLRADHLDVYGYARETAPTIRRLAEEGVRFTDCFSQATWTKASSASLLTSLYPTTHAVSEFGQRLPASATTLAEVLRDAGYATLAVSSIMFTGKFSNLHQGFEVMHEAASLPRQRKSKTALVYVDRLLPWLEEHRDEPFFVFLHVFDPHDPYEPQPPYDTMWALPEERDAHRERAAAVLPHIRNPAMRRIGMATSEELAAAGVDAEAYVDHLRDWYDGSIRAMDAELARLLEALDNLGLDERTLIVLTSDHGEEFLDHGRMFHGQSVYAELNHVPLVMRWPGVLPAGLVREEVVQGVDVMPTLLDLLDLPVPERAQGQSLVSLLATPEHPLQAARAWRPVPAVTAKAVTGRPVPPPPDTEVYAFVTERWKLVHHVRRRDGEPEFELFDRSLDPLDAHDVAAEHPDVVAELTEQLGRWRNATLDAQLPSDEEAAVTMSSEELEHLRALGYLR